MLTNPLLTSLGFQLSLLTSQQKVSTSSDPAPRSFTRRPSASSRPFPPSSTFPSVRTIKISSLSVHPLMISASGLAGAHQRTNASLAIALVRTFLASPRLPAIFRPHALLTSSLSPLPHSLISPDPLPLEIVQGLKKTSWPGRCQVEPDTADKALTWFLDGAHTVESLVCCGEWFREVSVGAESRCASLPFGGSGMVR